LKATRIAALGFLGFSVTLATGTWALPAGAGGLPGPGLFPLGIAALMAALSASLIVWPGPPPPESAATADASKRLAGVVGLLFVYLLLWGTGLFAPRTAVFLFLMLRWTGQSWRASAGVAAALTAVVVVAFQLGLKVTLE
jgi:hypothetical protein